jgi:hypothetical protein
MWSANPAHVEQREKHLAHFNISALPSIWSANPVHVEQSEKPSVHFYISAVPRCNSTERYTISSSSIARKTSLTTIANESDSKVGPTNRILSLRAG